ncbi:chitinase-like protein PB1E7.04c [Xenia sp. Carnegie-2017]|uniref:chitinase-like protein PB1E7.04c n=1 Tax=Xenia sp. Carnegie-2017 TaxID=2897299 RepID=UPI001F03D185|nr:chitinase-like protein PB1E7.04c [Xenia sp. Carnegie-2017]
MSSLENFLTTQNAVKSSSVVLKESTSLKTMEKSSMSSIYEESYSLTKDDFLTTHQKTPSLTKLMSSPPMSSLENFVTTQNAVKSSSVVLKESTSLKTMEKSSMSSIYEESYSLTKDDFLTTHQKTPSLTKLMSSPPMSSLENFVTTQNAVKSSSVVLKESTSLKTMDKSSMSSIYEESYSLTKDDFLTIHQKSTLTSFLAKTMSSPSMTSITKPHSPSALASTMKAMSPPSMILTTKLVVADYHSTTFIYQTIRNVSTVKKSSLFPTMTSYNPKGTLSPEIDKTETYFSSYTIQTNTSTNLTEKKGTSTTIFDLKRHDVFKSTSKLWKTPALVTSNISKQNNTIRYSTVSSIPLTTSIIDIVVNTFEIRLLITSEPFRIEYMETSSPEFNAKSKQIEENFDKVFRDTTYYSSSEVIRFFEGSLGCIAKVHVKSNDVKVVDIDQTLRNKIDEDEFGEMVVSSIEVKVFEVVTAKQDEKKRHSGWSTLAIVFVSVLGGICVLLVLCVIILCIQKRQYTHYIEESNGLQEHSPSIQLKRHGSILAEDEERVPMKTFESMEF